MLEVRFAPARISSTRACNSASIADTVLRQEPLWTERVRFTLGEFQRCAPAFVTKAEPQWVGSQHSGPGPLSQRAGSIFEMGLNQRLTPSPAWRRCRAIAGVPVLLADSSRILVFEAHIAAPVAL
jgi:hypothetical protein